MGVRLVGCGKAMPALQIPNNELENIVETNDEWISSRTGISSRGICSNETTTDLACMSSCSAMGVSFEDTINSDCLSVLEKAKTIRTFGWQEKIISPDSIDLIIFLSITPDSIVPNNSSLLKRTIGCSNAIAFDVNAACTGFIYGISIAQSMMIASHLGNIKSNEINRALIVSSERMSRLTDWSDRNTCVLFGDGSGSVVLEWDQDSEGILSCYLENTDDLENALVCKNSYTSLLPFDENGVVFDKEALELHRSNNPDPKQIDYSYINNLDLVCDGAGTFVDRMLGLTDLNNSAPEQVVHMDGQRVFKFAARSMEHAVREAAKMANVNISELKLIVPHQANFRIIEFAAKRLDLPLDKFQLSISETGNTSSAGVPMALTDAILSGSISEGDLVALVAFGGGLTSGATIIKI